MKKSSILGLYWFNYNNNIHHFLNRDLFAHTEDPTLFIKNRCKIKIKIGSYIEVNKFAQYLTDLKLSSLNQIKTGYICIQGKLKL